jgi:hypothetical protein
MLKMVLEINPHRGEPYLLCPQVFCDQCGERIEGSGNMLHLAGPKGPLTGEMFHTHKQCNHIFEHLNPAPEDSMWYWRELQDLPIQLAANLGMGDTRGALLKTIKERPLINI